ncbi:DUF2789 family protein [Polynucleobacter sp. MWH-UH23A]|uniref:DUF2789 family protein n=1 Tax=Polynucleobacter sp. MWH-UH23A TaxID=1855613 RepID=UPI003364C0ED
MNKPFESLQDLFMQLGLPNKCSDIELFIKSHAPLDKSILLADAQWWSPVQKDFLRDELLKDADWAEPIDLLNNLVRQLP